jgi:hypothetical protein
MAEGDEVKIDFANEEVKKQISEHVNKNYREFVPKEFAEHASMASIPDLQTLAKSYVNAQQLVGRKGIIPPTEKDGQEAWDTFFKALGRPEKPTEYEYDKTEGLDLDLDEVKQGFSDMAHKFGLSKKQAKEAWKYFEGKTKEGQDNVSTFNKDRYEKEWGELKKELGAAYPDKIKKLDKLVAKYGDDDFREYLKKTQLGKEAKLVKFLSKIADSIAEDKIESGSQATTFTPKEAMSKANDIRSNKSNPLYDAYWKKEHPRHDEAMTEVNKLYEMANKVSK